MSQLFSRSGISFRYPAHWTLETEESDEGWTVTVQSPRSAFLLVSLRTDCDDPADLAEQTLAALRSEYPHLDADDCMDTISGQPAIGHNIEFITLDLINTCWTRCTYAPQGCVLLLGQVNDLDQEADGTVLQAIRDSVQVEEDFDPETDDQNPHPSDL